MPISRIHVIHHASADASHQFHDYAYYTEAEASSTIVMEGIAGRLASVGPKRRGLYWVALLANVSCDVSRHVDDIRDVLAGPGW